MAVREQHGFHGPGPKLVIGERKRGARGLLGQKRIDDDPAGLSLDQRHHRQVITAKLIDAVRHLEEAVNGVELSLAPKRGIDARRRRTFQEVEFRLVPDDAALLVADDAAVDRSDKAAARIVEIGLIRERKLLGDGGVRFSGRLGGLARRGKRESFLRFALIASLSGRAASRPAASRQQSRAHKRADYPKPHRPVPFPARFPVCNIGTKV